MVKKGKPSGKHEKVSGVGLGKSGRCNSHHDWNILNNEAVALLVNMSAEINPSNQRIKFKDKNFESSSSFISRVKSSQVKFNSSVNLNITESEDFDKLLDSTICYHPRCSFAYNITQEHLRTASLIAECVPKTTYERLAALWNLDPTKTSRKHGNKCQLDDVAEENQNLEEFLKNVERDLGIQSEISEDLQVEADSLQEATKTMARVTEAKDNPYLKFLRKDGALDVERRIKANLRKKAKKITKMIIKNFLDWYQTLGGNDNETLIDDSTLEELFQIGFDLPEAKALVIRIKEMPTVPECLAQLRKEPKHATRYVLREFLKQDVRKEDIPTKMFAFGSMLPKEYPPLRYKPPRNSVRETWMECSRVPSDLDTMKTIWSGLEKLRSTIAFGNWLKSHSQISPPAYLLRQGLLSINYEEWNQMYKGFEVEVDPGEVVSSEWKSHTEKPSVEDLKIIGSSSENFDSLSSF